MRIEFVEAALRAELRTGEEIVVRARVRLGSLTPEDVRVEVYHGRVDAQDEIFAANSAPMRPLGTETRAAYDFESAPVQCSESGRYGFTVRVLPHYAGIPTRFLPGYIVWAESTSGR